MQDVRRVEPRLLDVGHAAVAHRAVGEGPDVVFVHGWPLHGLTWRDVVRPLSQHYRCHLLDLPGAGASRWSDDTPAGLRDHARAVGAAIDALGLSRVALVGHDSGGAVSRLVAADLGERAWGSVVTGSEIPHHRPWLIMPFMRIADRPVAGRALAWMLGSRTMRRSPLGMGACFRDVARSEGEFAALFLDPIAADARVRAGQMLLPRDWSWDAVDALEETHRATTAPTYLLWGEHDPYFPAAKARRMTPQFGGEVVVQVLPGLKLFPHEEEPARYADEVHRFLRRHAPA